MGVYLRRMREQSSSIDSAGSSGFLGHLGVESGVGVDTEPCSATSSKLLTTFLGQVCPYSFLRFPIDKRVRLGLGPDTSQFLVGKMEVGRLVSGARVITCRPYWY